MKRIGLTGATGFIGTRLIEIYRKKAFDLEKFSFSEQLVSDYDLKNIDVFIHLAGIVHQMEGQKESLYHEVNFLKTIELAKKAKEAGVGQFIFMSTIKVYGLDSTTQRLTEESVCHPTDPYGESKYNAEECLWDLADESFNVAVIRTPVVYGPHVKGNILKLLNLVYRVPLLPFGLIFNKRSMIYVDNLIAYIERVILTQYSGTILPMDEEAYSTSKLVDQLRISLGKKSYNIAIPKLLRNLIAMIKPNLYNRLFASLEIDPKISNQVLGFHPPYSNEEGVRLMCAWYKNEYGS